MHTHTHPHTHTHTRTACVGSSPGGHNYINTAQWCHVGSGCGSGGITVVSGGGGGFGVGIFIGGDRGGGHFWLPYSFVLPTYFAIMPGF